MRRPTVTKIFTWQFTFQFWHILARMTRPFIWDDTYGNYFWQQSCFASQEADMEGLWDTNE